jgi:hypothetical protein
MHVTSPVACPSAGGVTLGGNCYVTSVERRTLAGATEACGAMDGELLWILEEIEYRVLSQFLHDHRNTSRWLTGIV